MQNRAGQSQSLLLPPTHGSGELLALLEKIVFFEQFLDPRRTFRLRKGIDFGDELQVFKYGHVAEQGKSLRHVADLWFQQAGGTRYLGTEHRGMALRRGQKTAQHANRR